MNKEVVRFLYQVLLLQLSRLLQQGLECWGGSVKEALAYFLRSLGTEMLTAHKHKMTRCVQTPF